MAGSAREPTAGASAQREVTSDTVGSAGRDSPRVGLSRGRKPRRLSTRSSRDHLARHGPARSLRRRHSTHGYELADVSSSSGPAFAAVADRDPRAVGGDLRDAAAARAGRLAALGPRRRQPAPLAADADSTSDNVSTLVPAWRYEMTKAGVPSRPSQSTPLLVDGVLYLSFPYYRVVALEPETGDEIWEYTAPGDWNSPEHQFHWTGGSMRGLAYWEGDDVTPPADRVRHRGGRADLPERGDRIPNPRFGNDGYVDMKTPEVMNGFPNMHYGISSGVAVWKHLVFTGVHNADETGSKGPAGDVRAWDLRTATWCGRSTPCRIRASSATRPGSTARGATSAAPTRGRSSPSTRSAASCTCRWVRPQRLLRHGPPRRQSLLELDRGRRRDDGGAAVAFPGRPSRPVGSGHAGAADPVRRRAGRRDDSRRRRHDEVPRAVHLRPGHRRADLRDRGTTRPAGQHARGVLRADAAVPGEAAALRTHPLHDGRRRDGDARAHRRMPRAVDAVRRRPEPRPLHAAVHGGRAGVPVHRRRDGVHRRHLRSEPRVLHHQLRGTPATSASS